MFYGARKRAIDEGMASLRQAGSYAQWCQAADHLDTQLHLDEWRASDPSPYYDHRLIQRQLSELRSARIARDTDRLISALADNLDHVLCDIAEPALYNTAFGGTKHLIDRFLDESVRALEALACAPELSFERKRQLFWRARRSFGRSALMLSGGGTLGFCHLGVISALFEADLLPSVLCGASMGAMIGAGVAARTDAELRQMFAAPERLARKALQRLPLSEVMQQGSLLKPAQLYRTILRNVGDATFREAYERTGRVLTIPLSPTRRRQEPRLLCYLTTPDVLLASGAMASSAVPGLFPPVGLRARAPDGRGYRYLPTERWVDGTMRADLPVEGVGRLHNASLFLVSQTNPHILPFVSRGQGPTSFAWRLMAGIARDQTLRAADLARLLARHTPLGPGIDAVHALVGQPYRGDIDIIPDLPPAMWTRVLSNATEADLTSLFQAGRRSAWPRLKMIRDRTCVRRTLDRCIETIRREELRLSREASMVPAEYR